MKVLNTKQFLGFDPTFMEIELKQQILERRKEIERELMDMLKETRSDFSLDHVRDAIYNEDDKDDMMKVVAMFDRGGDTSELSNVLELVTEINEKQLEKIDAYTKKIGEEAKEGHAKKKTWRDDPAVVKREMIERTEKENEELGFAEGMPVLIKTAAMKGVIVKIHTYARLPIVVKRSDGKVSPYAPRRD